MDAIFDPAPEDRPFAVVDIGSNSARMIVFRLRQGEHLDVIEDARAPLRLARELRDSDRLGPEAIERTVEALHDFVAIAKGAGASQMIAVATSAVRDAADGHELVERAHRLGVPLQTIDGDHEAMLGFYGAVHDLPVTSGLTFDVGGGSAEISAFHDRRLMGSWSMPLGSLRVSDAFLASNPPGEAEMRSLRASVKASMAGAGISRLADGEQLVGIGGTVRNLAKIDLRRTEYPMPLLHGYRLTDKRLSAVIDELAGRTMKRRTRVPGLNPDRADTIVGGALVIQGIAKYVGASEIVVSSRGVREGLALATAGASAPSPEWVRSISLATLAVRFRTWNASTAERRAGLAAELMEALDPAAPTRLREMLAHAATVLDVGRAVDYYDRFEHAADIVIAADLAGFSHADLGALTAILRQADDDTRLGPYGRLVPDDDRPAVLRAATALTLADELNRRIPPGAPAPLSCNWMRGGFEVVAPVPSGWRPRGVARRFRSVFDTELLIVANESTAVLAPALEPD
ncbi:MAG: Ppx/GppA family phosphatase [Actinomycetota bacterium]|nr:Ppx/GppA family phosphatase [Actinomycetota bacterium]